MRAIDGYARGVGPSEQLWEWTVGNNGQYFATSQRCRHLETDMSEGSIDSDGCLVWPGYAAKYDVTTGRTVRGPQGIFTKIPGLGAAFMALSRVVPLRLRPVVERDWQIYVEDSLD